MKRTFTLFLLGCAAVAAMAAEPGVPLRMATERARQLKDVAYELQFRIPDTRQEPVTGEAGIAFTWSGSGDLNIDFAGTDVARQAIINGRRRTVTWQAEHILIPARWLKRGRNVIRLLFTAADKSLNRNDEYLYTLFVPANARSVFPCFDQPDLKARFTLRLHLPDGWTSINSAECGHPIPTYLFSFVAGQFSEQTATRDGRTLRALYRETDPMKTAQLDKVFDEAALSIRWMEHYTGIPYPFRSYGFVVLPGYQFGGMEHPGAIQFVDREIFLGPHPTPDEELTRLELIAHETAHMWFGDLVTMKWFNDVWTKEVFANFFAAKIAREQFPAINHDLNFLKAYQVPALATDRTDGTHAIQQPLGNLNRAGLLYGNIIYDKAPIMMRKMEQQMGADALRAGLQTYLRNYAYGNATWDQLIAVLDQQAPGAGISDFSEVWVKQKGLPLITTEYRDGCLRIRQSDPYGRGLIWKQRFKTGLFLPGTDTMTVVDVNMQASEVSIPIGRKPTVIIPNCDGSGYGRFSADSAGCAAEAGAWQAMPREINRYAAVMNLYENYLMHRVTPEAYLDATYRCLTHERNPLIASTLCTYVTIACFDQDEPTRRAFEPKLYAAARRHPLPSVRQQLMRSIARTAVTPEVVDSLYAVWFRQSDTLLTVRDYTQMACHLAIRRPLQWTEILQAQRQRLKNADEQREFDFISRACTPDTSAQERLFISLLDKANRAVEPWAQELLSLLSGRDREPMNNRLIIRGLDALTDIQRTGDIFFPTKWLTALLSGHRSEEAKALVKSWISTHSDWPDDLMNKVKQSAWPVIRLQ